MTGEPPLTIVVPSPKHSRRLQLSLSEVINGPDGKPQVISTTHSSSMDPATYAVSTQFSRYFLELVRDMDRNLDVAILEFKELHKL